MRAGDGEPAERFGRLLLIIIAGFLLSGLGGTWATTSTAVLNGVLVVIAFRNTGLRSLLPRTEALVVLVAFAIVAIFVRIVADETSNWQALASFLQALVLLSLIIGLLRAVLHHHVVTIQTIVGAVAAYMLIGLMFGWIFLGIDTLDDAQLSLDSTDTAAFPEFSFITLTTLGYGNQVPTAAFAARIAVIEAVLGQVFLATFVARLVSLYGRRRD